MKSFTDRMIGAARLDVPTYEEVEHDASATTQAAAVVLLSSIAAGIGSLTQAGWSGLLVGTLIALLGWIIWAALTWVIGTKMLPEESTEADVGQLMRTIGFSASPGILRVAGVIPAIGPIIMLACSVWMLVAMVVAVRQALDYTSTWRALGVCVIGWVVLLALQMLVFAMIGAPDMGQSMPQTG